VHSIIFVDYPSLISAKRIAIIFVTCDIISFIVQVSIAYFFTEKNTSFLTFCKTIDPWSYHTFEQKQFKQFEPRKKYFVGRFVYSDSNLCFLHCVCRSFRCCCGKEWTTWWQMEMVDESFVCSLCTHIGN
jgi:hypothetical protein